MMVLKHIAYGIDVIRQNQQQKQLNNRQYQQTLQSIRQTRQTSTQPFMPTMSVSVGSYIAPSSTCTFYESPQAQNLRHEAMRRRYERARQKGLI